MTSLLSMEDLFYGPPEATWILPTRDDRRYYREREYSPPRRFLSPEPLRPVERYHHQPRPMDHRDLRPVMRVPHGPLGDELRPMQRLAHVQTVPQPVPMNAGHEVIRKVVEVPVIPSAVPVPTQVVMAPAPGPPPPTQVVTGPAPGPPPPTQVVTGPAPGPPPPTQVVTGPAPGPPPRTQVVTGPAPGPPPPTQVVTAPKPAPSPPTQVVTAAPAPQVVQKRSVSPPRAIVHHPIELKVPMCCEKCARKVKDRLLELEGVENVVTDQYNQKVIVHGRVDPSRVLQRVKLVKKRSVFWDMTVDYSEKYRRARDAEDAAIAREQSKAAAVKAEAKAAKVVMTPAAPQVVVKLPQEQDGVKVTAILPPERDNNMPYVVNSRVHNERYASPPKGFRQEYFHDPREEMMRRPEFYNNRRHSEVH